MIGQKVSLAFLIDLSMRAMGFIGMFFIARWMGPEALGIISYGFAFVGILSFLQTFGFSLAHIKRISEGGDIGNLLGTYFAIRIALTAIFVITVLLTILFYDHVLGKKFEETHLTVIYIALITYTILGLSNIGSETFAGRVETAKQKVPELIGKIVEIPLKIAVAVLGFGVIALAGSALIGAVITIAISWYFLLKLPIGRPDWKIFRSYAAFALPATLILSSNAVVDHLDKLMIGSFWDVKTLGYYAAGQQLAIVFMLLSVAVGTIAFPKVSFFMSRGDIHSIKTFSHNLERYLSLILLPVGVLIFFIDKPLTALLLGNEFYYSGSIFAILAFNMIIKTINTPYINLILGTNHAKYAAVLSVITLCLNVVFHLLFIPKSLFGIPCLGLGAIGAAFSRVLSNLVMGVFYRLVSWRLVGTTFHTSVIKHALASGAMAASMIGFLHFFQIPGFYILTVCLLLGSAVYCGLLFLIRELSLSDISFFWRIISPKTMFRYVLGEVRGSSK